MKMINAHQRGIRVANQTVNEDDRGAIIGRGVITMSQIVSAQRDEALEKALQHEVDITNLREKLDEKDSEITDLRQQLKEIQEKNNNLQIRLKTKDDEVEKLQERIQTLEDEKKDLQDELSMVETKLKRLENEMKSITKKTKEHEEENRKLKENLQKFEYNLNTTKDTLTMENEKLKKKVKQLEETKLALPMEYPALPFQQPSKQSMASIHLGELCWRIQGSMYQKVLPNHYTPLCSYKVKNIEKDMKKLAKTPDEKEEASAKWQKLKSKLNWSEELEEAVRALQESRNTEAHPPLDENALREYAKVLEREGSLKGWLSLERVNKLIDIWFISLQQEER